MRILIRTHLGGDRIEQPNGVYTIAQEAHLAMKNFLDELQWLRP